MGYRSCIAVPADNDRLILKAAQLGADRILLDLEDSVPEAGKGPAREGVAALLRSQALAGREVSVRINSVASGLATHDILRLVGESSGLLHSLVIPKVVGAGDVRFVDRLVSDLAPGGTGAALRIEVLVETPAGVAHVHEILGAADRLAACVFGANGYAREIAQYSGSGESGSGEPAPEASSWAMGEIVNAAAAAGVPALAGPSREFRDEAVYAAETTRLRRLGFQGRWCIHPRQVEWTNQVFGSVRERVAG